MKGAFTRSLVLRAATICAQFVSQIILARVYTPHQVGDVFLVMSLAGWIMLIMQFGLLTSFPAKLQTVASTSRESSLNSLVRKTFRFLLVSAFFMTVFAACVWTLQGKLFESNISDEVFYFGLSLGVVQVFLGLAFEILRAKGDTVVGSFYLSSLPQFLLLPSLLALQWSGTSNSNKLLLSCVVGCFFLSLAAAVVRIQKKRVLEGKFKVADTRDQSRSVDTKVFWFISLATYMQNQMLFWAIANFYDSAEVAKASLAWRICQLLFIPMTIWYQLLPNHMMNLSERYDSDLERFLRKSATVSTALILPAFIVLFLFPGPVIDLVFGSKFGGSEPFIRLFLVYVLFDTFTGMRGVLLMYSKNEKLTLLIMTATMLTTLTFLAFFLGRLSILAITCGFVAISACQMLVEIFTIRRILRVKTYFSLLFFRQIITEQIINRVRT